MSPVPDYILRLMVVGSMLGAGHGISRGWRDLKRDVPAGQRTPDHVRIYLIYPSMHDGLYGALFGPWDPVLVPAALFSWRKQIVERCQYFRDKLQ